MEDFKTFEAELNTQSIDEELAKRNEQSEQEAKELRKSRYREWAQLNLNEKVINSLNKLIAENPTAFRVFLFILQMMDNYNAVVASYKVMQEALNVSQSTIKRSV
ncbi:MAG: hypothetical protein J1E56_07355, partial [Ruminococcus sp.]|nr:hypothetical protein [Ruminococcus sp.]